MSPERKGTAQAIRAFAGVRGPARLVIHSQVHLQDALPDLQAHMREMSEAGRLQVIEKTVGAPGLYHLGDVYVYPTRLEGIGLTIAEALASGLPAIVPDQPPMNEFVPRDVGCGARVPVIRQYARADGYYWPQCLVDRDALTASMQEYVDARRELPSRKRCAYEHAVRNLNWASRKDAVCKAFEQSRLLRSPGKHEAIQAAVRYEYSRAGGKLDLWLHFPLLCQIGQTASQAAQTAKRPFSSLLRKIIR